MGEAGEWRLGCLFASLLFTFPLAAGSPCGQDALLFGEAGQKELLPSLPHPSCAIKMPHGQHRDPPPPSTAWIISSPLSWRCTHMDVYILKGQGT